MIKEEKYTKHELRKKDYNNGMNLKVEKPLRIVKEIMKL